MGKFSYTFGKTQIQFKYEKSGWDMTHEKTLYFLSLLERKKSGDVITDLLSDQKEWWAKHATNNQHWFDEFIVPDSHWGDRYGFNPKIPIPVDININIILDYDGQHCYFGYNHAQNLFIHKTNYSQTVMDGDATDAVIEMLRNIVAVQSNAEEQTTVGSEKFPSGRNKTARYDQESIPRDDKPNKDEDSSDEDSDSDDNDE